MTALIYSIDKNLSYQENALALQISGGPLQTSPLISLFKKEKMAPHIALIPFSQTFQALKLLSTSNQLYFNNKQIVIDLFGKNEFYYQVHNDTIQGIIKTSSEEYAIQMCDFICGGPPQWFIKGYSLKFIETHVSYKDFKNSFGGQFRPVHDLEEEANLDKEVPRVVFLDNYTPSTPAGESPFPILVLNDRSGAFANLWMEYNTQRLPLHNPNILLSNKRKRNLVAEMAWEKDLLETDYAKKIVDTTHYYCPLEKVSKSLAFLLEIGWKVFDHKGNRIVACNQSELKAELSSQTITIKGRIKFDNFQANITDIKGAFNRRECFVQLDTGVVGLLPNQWGQNGLNLLMEESEVIGDALHIKKNRLGTFSELFETNSVMSLGSSLEQFKDRLLTFKGIEESLPEKAFHGQLRPYQQEGLNWLSFLFEYGFHGILADDMGLGKTVQVLAFLSRIHAATPVLIVVPTSLIFNWKKEIERFLPSWHVHIHHGPDRPNEITACNPSTIILTSYTTLRLDLPLFSDREFTCIILDEAQAIKNHYTQTFQAVKKLKGQFRLEITGTPIENNIQELWAHFHFLMPDLFGNESSFAAEVQAGSSDSRYLKRIQKKIRPFLLRRKKEEVAKDLPEKVEQTVWLEMGEQQRSVYEKFLSGVRHHLIKKVESEGMGKHRIEILEAILRLRQICCHPLLVTAQEEFPCAESAKLEMLMQDFETIQAEGRKALIYSQFTSMLSLIGKNLSAKGQKYAYLDGSTVNREQVVQNFQENSALSFFLISLKAGGVGINLTAADYVLLYDPWWNEAIENQAIARAHRIGRKDAVIAKRYIMAESIEEKMMKLKMAKKTLTNDLLEENMDHVGFSEEDLLFLLS